MLFYLLTFFAFTSEDKYKFSTARKRSYVLGKQPMISFKSIQADEKNWYFIHFFQKPQNEFDVTQTIIKNTYQVYLSQKEIQKYANISFYKMIPWEDKIFSEGVPLEAAELFLVSGVSDLSLPNNDYYTVIRKYSNNSVLVSIDKKVQQKALQTLAKNHEVLSITTYQQPHALNNLIAGFTQKNTQTATLDNQSGIYHTERYLENKGINGTDEIITVVDTLIDIHHAMFYDINVKVEFNKELKGHRKLVYYNYQGSLNNYTNELETFEHGTHVAGIAAGNSACTNPDKGTHLFNGIAPGAKIIYGGHFNQVAPEEVTSIMKTYNSKISTNSWGTPDFSPLENALWGEAAASVPDILILFAAGNGYTEGNFSVADPGGSKNVLTVGAIDSFYAERQIAELTSVDKPDLPKLILRALISISPWFTGSFGGPGSNSDVVAIDMAKHKNDVCELISNPYISILYSDNPADFQSLGCSNINITFGVYAILDRTNIENYLKSSKKVNLTDTTPILMNKTIAHAPYSSTGPGYKGIMKPDIVTPGTKIISAGSRANNIIDHGCRNDSGRDFASFQGTSMATPNAAGASALVRNYFASGKWKNGEKVDLNSSTLRALMINSAKHPTKSKTPDIFLGHGVVDLSTILPVDKQFGVALSKNASIDIGGHVSTKLTVKNSTRPLQVTLSYLDPQLNVDSPYLLTNDLDLVVKTPSGEFLYGDHLWNKDSQHLSTNEKVIIDSPAAGEYQIHVYCDGIGTSSQAFSVVASGDIDDQYLTFTKTEECGCPTCENGRCKCDAKHVGHHCQIEVSEGLGEYTLKPHEIKRVIIKSTDEKMRIRVKAFNLSEGYEEFYVSTKCHSSLSDYEKQAYISNFSSSSITISSSNKQACVAIFNNNVQDTKFAIQIRSKNMTPTIIGVVVAVVVAVVVVVIAAVVIIKIRKKRG